MSLWRDGTGASFAIVDRADELLGAVTRFGPEGHGATVGLWLAPAGRGRGIGTRALRLVIDWTFATTEVVRIDCYIEVGNEPSMRMVERVGLPPGRPAARVGRWVPTDPSTAWSGRSCAPTTAKSRDDPAPRATKNALRSPEGVRWVG